MLLFDRSRINVSAEKPVATGTTVTAEGQPLVADYTSGVFGVKPAVADANDKFVGVSFAQQVTLVALPYYEQVVVPAGGGSVSLSRTSIYTGTTKADGSVTGALTVVAGAPAAGQMQINLTNGTVTFNAAQAGETVTVAYRYQPTTVEALTVQGNNPAGGSASFILDSVGVISDGEVYTTEFNTTIDWLTRASGAHVVAVKDGLFTSYDTAANAAADNAVVITGAIITNVPAVGSTSEYGYGSNAVLGVKFAV